MIRRYDCPHCEEGRVQCSRYGGNDPSVWWSPEPCEDCDGLGNVEIDDEGHAPAGITTTHDAWWHARPSGSSRTAWKAEAAGLSATGHTETDAVRKLIDALAERADEMAAEAAWAEQKDAA